jgi:hypothetical protein
MGPGSEHDDRYIRELPDVTANSESVRSLGEHDVKQDKSRLLQSGHFDGRVATSGMYHIISNGPQHLGHQMHDLWLILDYQNLLSYVGFLSFRQVRARFSHGQSEAELATLSRLTLSPDMTTVCLNNSPAYG